MVRYVEDRSCTTQFELGQMFHQGDEKSRDYRQAVKWYMQSAKKGYRRAQRRLGVMYSLGQGVKQNYIRAYAWCKISAAQQSQKALDKVKELEYFMSAEQIASATRLAEKYYARYVAPFAH